MCPPFVSLLVSAGRVAFLFICLPGLSVLAFALFRWPRNISIHVSQACHWWCPPFSAGDATFLFIPETVCRSVGFLNSFLRCVRPLCRCWCPPFSAGHVAFLFICLPGLSLLVSALFRWRCNISIHSPSSLPLRRVSQFFLKMCPPFLSVQVSAGQRVRLPSGLSPLVSLLVGHCVRLVSLLSPFVSGLVSLCWSLCPSCLPSVSFCFPSCLSSC